MKKKLLITALSLTLAFTSIGFCYAESIDSASGNAAIGAADMQAAVNIKTVTPVVTAKSYSYNKVKLTWEAVSGADGYEVYRKTSKNGKFTKLASVASSKESYINTGLTCGKTYWYKVRAYKGSGGKKTYSKYSAVKSTYPRPSKVKGVTAAFPSAALNNFDISWDKVTGASGYQLQYNPAGEGWKTYHYEAVEPELRQYYKGSWNFTGKGLKIYPEADINGELFPMSKYIKSTKAIWTVGDDASSYSFRVRAYRTVNGKKVFGLYSEAVTIYPVWKSGEELQDFVHTWVDENYPTYDRAFEEAGYAGLTPEEGTSWGTTWTWYTMSQYDTKEYVLKSLCEGTLKTYFHAWWGLEEETRGILYTRDLGDGTWQIWWLG